jgi:hypothetical protein
VVDVRRLQEAEHVAAELEPLAVHEAPHALGVDAEARRVQLDRECRAAELRPGRLAHEAIHAAVLVTLPVEEHEVREPRRVEHLADGLADVL